VRTRRAPSAILPLLLLAVILLAAVVPTLFILWKLKPLFLDFGEFVEQLFGPLFG
jgi:hypothetical protein